MIFNPDLTSQAQEVMLSRKTKEISHSLLTCNDASVSLSSSQIHLRVILDTKLNFDEHLTSKNSIFQNIQNLRCTPEITKSTTKNSLITIYKVFVRPHLDYGDILYDQAYNIFFH